MSVLSRTRDIRAILFENRGLRQTVLKNAFWLFSGQTAGRAIRAIIVIYAARLLGTAGFGAASYALGIASLFAIVGDMGLPTILTRTLVQKPELKERYAATIFGIKTACVFLAALLVIFIGPLVSSGVPEALALLPLAALILAFDSMRDFAIAFVRAKEKMEWEAALTVATNAAVVVCGAIFLIARPTPAALLAAYAAGSGIGLALALFALRRTVMSAPRLFSKDLVGPVMRAAVTIAFAGFLSGTMLTIDTIMIGWWHSAAEVGLYAAAQKPIQIVYGLMAIAGASLLPAFSRLAPEGGGKVKRHTKRALIASGAVAALLSIALIALARPIVILLYGNEYLGAVPAFMILSLTLVANLPAVLGFSALFAKDKRREILTSSLIGALGNAGLNALLIPPFGIVGAGVSTLITQIVNGLYIVSVLRKLDKK